MFESDMTFGLDLFDYNRDYWETKEGKLIKIKLMETSHIKNCIKMLENAKSKNNDYTDYFDYKIREFKEELEYRNMLAKHIKGEDK